MATQARITLKALNGEAPLPERTLTLHPHLRTIQIGRASKSPSKGLQAAVDNAWFDSPVMSRNHAEITLNAENNIITIRDIGSMHGTFVNDLQLRRLEPSGLSNGDLVVFGAEVKRNLDTFPACAFRVNYEFLPFKASNSYAFPESDEEDYEISDDDLEENEEPSSEDGVSIESPPRKASNAIHAIDLTRDDSPASSSIAEVDSAGQTRVEKDLMNSMAGRPADINLNADPSDEIEYGDGVSSEEDSMDEQDDSENEDDGDHEMDDEVDRVSEQAAGLASLGLYLIQDAPIPESNLRTIIGESENIVEEDDHDDESDFGLSDAGAEGLRALFDDGLVDGEGDSCFGEDADEESDSGSVIAYEVPTKAPVSEEKPETPKHITFASLPSDQLPEMTSSWAHFTENPPTFGRLVVSNNSTISARQPSPSDAAMVKTATPAVTVLNHTANPVKVHHLPSQEFQNLAAQSLGDKTGKHAFFAAREDNKAKIHAGENAQSASSSWLQREETITGPTPEEKTRRSISAMERFRERKRRMEEAKTMSETEKVVLPVPTTSTRAINFSIPPIPTLPYLDDHTQAPNAIRTPSPEPDMTSAVTYNESKASMASSNKHTSGRSGLRIHDIIEGEAGDHNSNNLKRKADDISEAIENEVRVWASSSTALNNLEAPSGISASSQAAVGEEQSKIAPPTNAPEQRPTKRLRKIVESVGYVALGGATLFGALVLSAPDFL